VLVEDELKDHYADAECRQVGNRHRGNEIERCDDGAQQHDQNQQHNHDRHGEDEPHVVVVVVTHIGIHGGQSGDRNRRVGQFRVGLRAARGVHDL
jgi:hypothetical protein